MLDQEERNAIYDTAAAIRTALELLPEPTPPLVLELLGTATLTLKALLDPE